jgi:hypothetical protein
MLFPSIPSLRGLRSRAGGGGARLLPFINELMDVTEAELGSRSRWGVPLSFFGVELPAEEGPSSGEVVYV